MSDSGSAFGSRLAGAGGRTAAAGSASRQAVAHRELVEAAHRHHGPSRTARRERRVVGVALAQVHEELRHQPVGDAAQVVDAAAVEEPQVAAQVASVGLQRVVGEPALDHEVVQVGPQRTLDR